MYLIDCAGINSPVRISARSGQTVMQQEKLKATGTGRHAPLPGGMEGGQLSTPCPLQRLRPRTRAGFSLIELLCVIAILSILASLLMPVLFKTYKRIKSQAEEVEAPEVARLLVTSARTSCGANPQFSFQSKSDFEEKCHLAPKCRNWVEAGTTEFVPFNFLDSTNKLVLSVHIGRNGATLYTFTKGDLSVCP